MLIFPSQKYAKHDGMQKHATGRSRISAIDYALLFLRHINLLAAHDE